MPVAVEEDSNWYLHCPGGSIDEDEREVKAQELWTTTKMDPLVSDFWHLLSKAASLLVDSFQKEYFQNVASFCQSLSITIVSQITGSHKRPNKQTNQLMWRQKMNIWWENKPFPTTGIFDNWLHSCQNYHICEKCLLQDYFRIEMKNGTTFQNINQDFCWKTFFYWVTDVKDCFPSLKNGRFFYPSQKIHHHHECNEKKKKLKHH